jgi:hypothetical protein
MLKMHLVKTKSRIVEMPADVIGTRPWFLLAALWTRSIELCTDWRNGRPEKATTDMLLPDALFRDMRARVEQFLYQKDPALVNDTQKVSSEMGTVIDTLHKIDWQKMESLGVVKHGDEPDSLIDMLTKHPADTLLKMRTLLEQMVNRAYTAVVNLPDKKDITGTTKVNLHDKIMCLQQNKTVSDTVAYAMHAVRTAGNVTAHGSLAAEDPKTIVLATALHFIVIVEWFITANAT